MRIAETSSPRSSAIATPTAAISSGLFGTAAGAGAAAVTGTGFLLLNFMQKKLMILQTKIRRISPANTVDSPSAITNKLDINPKTPPLYIIIVSLFLPKYK